MTNAALLALTSEPMCRTYAEVVDRLQRLDTTFEHGDGLRWFNQLYLEMTAAVATSAARHGFRDPVFMESLDCRFAQLYFHALKVYLSPPQRAPRAWCPMFDARSRSDIAVLQFALAGVNAHINRDLPVALIDTFRALGGTPHRPSDRYLDYVAIDAVLASVQATAKAWLLSGSVALLDRHLGTLDDMFVSWSFERAREHAWTSAEVAWLIRDDAFIVGHQLDALDRFVGFTSRSILHPLA